MKRTTKVVQLESKRESTTVKWSTTKAVTTDDERKIIAGAIISDEFLKQLYPALRNARHLIKNKSARTVLTWCLDYYDQHKRAPGPTIYLKLKDEREAFDGLDKADTKLIRMYLRTVAEDYGSPDPDNFDHDYEVTTAQQAIRQLQVEDYSNTLQGHISREEYAQAEEMLGTYAPLAATGDHNLAQMITAAEITTATFIEERLTKPRVILAPWLTAGCLAEVYGPRGVGKTWLVMAIAVAVTRKGYDEIADIGPWHVNRPTGVYYIDGEMSEHWLQERLRRLTTPLGEELDNKPLTILSANRFARMYSRQINLADASWRDAVYEHLSNNRRYGLLVLDNVASLTPGLNEDKKQEWDPVNQWLLSLRHKGVGVIFVHHAGKGGQQRGTSGREDALDVVLKLTQPKNYTAEDGAWFDVKFEKHRNVGPDSDLSPFALRIVRADDDGNVRWESEDPSVDETKLQAVAMLGDGKTQAFIAEALGVTQPYISKVKKWAMRQGYFDRRCEWTDKGHELRKGIDTQDYYELDR